MEALNFIVQGQKLKKDPGSSFGKMVAGTSGYYYFTFDLDDTWRGYACVACYKVDSNIVKYVPVVKGKAEISEDILRHKTFTVSLIGQKQDKAGNTVRITTNENKITQTGGI